MKRFSKILGIAVLLTGLFTLKMNARSVSVVPTGSDSGSLENSDGNPFVILGQFKGLHIMKLRPYKIERESDFLAELASSNTSQTEMEVTTPDGKKIWQSSVTLEQGYNAVKFKVQNLSSGIYFLHMKNAEGSATKTFIVK